MFFVREICCVILISVSLVVTGCAKTKHPPLATVETVDLSKYLGRWYEIALIPNQFQKNCVSDTQANYSLEDGYIRVRNRCKRADGKMEDASGIAKIVQDSGNAKLRVSFFRPFYGNYWILALDSDYQWVLVGEPGRKYGWILSRSPTLNNTIVQRLLDKAASLGYQRSAFKPSLHSNSSDVSHAN
jgi:apolipoprotein D and lipocalin family protein